MGQPSGNDFWIGKEESPRRNAEDSANQERLETATMATMATPPGHDDRSVVADTAPTSASTVAAAAAATATVAPPPAGGMESTAFPYKLHDLLEAADYEGFENIISWLPGNKSFKVHDSKTFEIKIIPRYLSSMSKYKSFIRQLNLYCFERETKGPDRGSYQHPRFVRGERDLCVGMVPIKFKGGVSRQPKNTASVAASRASSAAKGSTKRHTATGSTQLAPAHIRVDEATHGTSSDRYDRFDDGSSFGYRDGRSLANFDSSRDGRGGPTHTTNIPTSPIPVPSRYASPTKGYFGHDMPRTETEADRSRAPRASIFHFEEDGSYGDVPHRSRDRDRHQHPHDRYQHDRDARYGRRRSEVSNEGHSSAINDSDRVEAAEPRYMPDDARTNNSADGHVIHGREGGRKDYDEVYPQDGPRYQDDFARAHSNNDGAAMPFDPSQAGGHTPASASPPSPSRSPLRSGSRRERDEAMPHGGDDFHSADSAHPPAYKYDYQHQNRSQGWYLPPPGYEHQQQHHDHYERHQQHYQYQPYRGEYQSNANAQAQTQAQAQAYPPPYPHDAQHAWHPQQGQLHYGQHRPYYPQPPYPHAYPAYHHMPSSLPPSSGYYPPAAYPAGHAGSSGAVAAA